MDAFNELEIINEYCKSEIEKCNIDTDCSDDKILFKRGLLHLIEAITEAALPKRTTCNYHLEFADKYISKAKQFSNDETEGIYDFALEISKKINEAIDPLNR